MLSRAKIEQALELLHSSKIKERQEGLNEIRTLFDQDSAAKRYNRIFTNEGQKKPDKAWMPLLNALETCIRTEKNRSTDAAEKRLAVAAGTYRWLLEKAVTFFNKKLVVSVFQFLYKEIKYRGNTLHQSVALDFIKALECVASHNPHLNRLEEERTWEEIVELAFNVILGKPVNFLSLVEDGPPSPARTDNTDIFEDDSMAEDDDNKPRAGTKERRLKGGDEDAKPERKRRRDEEDVDDHPASKKSRQNTQPGPSQPVPRSFKGSRTQLAISAEQMACMSLLSVLFRSNSAPILRKGYTRAVLQFLQTFLENYPSDSSLHHDFLEVTLSTLKHVSLNKKNDVIRFARSGWAHLLEIWGTKNKTLKEGLVSILRMLFPFLTADSDIDGSTEELVGSLTKLWLSINGADKKWALEPLSLDVTRLEVSNGREEDLRDTQKAFRGKTFRAGAQLDPAQALSWALLELQADCAEKLFLHFESTPPPATPFTQTRRSRLNENPLPHLLQSIRLHSNQTLRIYDLQILLFFIDRHWNTIHDSMQSEVMRTLLEFVTSDDSSVQSWSFLCIAAVAYADFATLISSPASQTSSTRGPSTWDTVWAHAIRRTSSPHVCRAASHCAATVLFVFGNTSPTRRLIRSPLTPHRVLSEIETLAKDLDVQGPTAPYDSVCAFLSLCLRVANQDVRLYRMQLEEKVLSWLTDSWKLGQVDSSDTSLYLVSDVLRLLETICASSQHSSLICRIELPHCLTTETLVAEQQTRVIREYLLNAIIPPVKQDRSHGLPTLKGTSVPPDTDLIEPSGRERKISTFFLKCLEPLINEFSNSLLPRADAARKALDVAVISLSFESVLVLNGIQSNRRAVQSACKLISSIVSLLHQVRWTMEEKSLILRALEPLVSMDEQTYDDTPWEALSLPAKAAGIRTQTLRSLLSDNNRKQNILRVVRVKHLKALWCNVDVQSSFSNITDVLRNLLRTILDRNTEVSININDNFGIGHSTGLQSSGDLEATTAQALALRSLTGVCISFLSVGPLLQQSSGEPTRDKDLTELILNYATPEDMNRFLIVCPVYFDNIRKQILSLTSNDLYRFLEAFEALIHSYAWGKSESFHMQLLSLLDATLPLWISSVAINQDVGDLFRGLLVSYSQVAEDFRVWGIRDAIARLYDRYLAQDPSQRVWLCSEDDVETSPMEMLPRFLQDVDIRVRFRAAVLNARLLEIAEDPMTLYGIIREKYATNTNNFEEMLSRILSLGNIMVISAAVRRGPYWHLVETCFFTTIYNRHIEAILSGVAQRLGLNSLSELFEAYMFQLAYSIRQGKHNVLDLPVNLLGYKDRKERASRTIRDFTTANLLALGSEEFRQHGRRIFEGHCQAIQRSTQDVIRECFGVIVGYEIITFFDSGGGSIERLEEKMLRTLHWYDSASFRNTLKDATDGVAAAILRTLNDQDFTANGSIVEALRDVDESEESSQLFITLTKYRRTQDFDTHLPNLPNFSPHSILSALSWLLAEVPGGDNHALTYHVLQELFADVQRSFLVNEQLRLVNAISLWIAYRHNTTSFCDATLLDTLIRGSCSLLRQWDLVPAAQSILEWCFSLYISGNDPRFPDILTRVACLCHDYASDVDDISAIKERRQALLEWVDDQTYALSTLPDVKEQVKLALPAWPHEPSENLSQLFNAIEPARLSKVLTHNSVSTNKFRLVRRLRDHAQLRMYDHTQFAQTDFWKLKECMPPAQHLREEDVHAFASLLVLNCGAIDSFGSDPEKKLHHSQSRSRQHKELAKNKSHTPQSSIILILLNMLESDSEDGSRHAAYHTLRALMLTLSSDSLDSLSELWPSEYRIEVSYLREFRLTATKRIVPSLSTSLLSAEFMEAAHDFPKWISLVTTLLADVLSAFSPFYAQLCDILSSHVMFSNRVLPLLVQTLLQLSADASHSSSLSGYFEQLLASANTAISCRRSIIDVVLHLRHIQPEGRDALAYNRWLSISFLSLAQNAITCGAYTTALLFLELDAEYRDPSVNEDVSTEKIMYEIYSNIDEPDGFYAIRTHDHHHFLIKRFHHEREWEKAFRFHGAALEVDTSDTKEIEGLLQSFHSYGFSHIATQTLLDSDHETHSSMAYKLGWRAETWDLPESDEDRHPGSSLYLALRAVHRERDQGVTDAIIRNVLFKEMDHLRTLGSENIAQIRETIQTLMSLSQATQWRSSFIQDLITNKSSSTQEWSNFTAIEAGFQFDDIESIMATRLSLVKSARRKEQRHQIGAMLSPFSQTLFEVEKDCLLRLSQAALEAHQVQVALNSVIRAKNLEKISSPAVIEQFASVLWAHKEEKHAVEYLKDLRRDAKNPDPVWLAQLMARLGTWTAEACLEQPSFIEHEFFKPSISLIEKAPDSQSRATIYHQYAKFAEAQYKAALDSPDLIRLNVYRERKEKELKDYEQMTKGRSADKTMINAANAAKKVLAQDNKATADFIANRDAVLKQAIQMYSRCLEVSDMFDEDVPIRLCSLWLSNFDYIAIQKDLAEAINRVPSRKLVFLAHQIFSRLDETKTEAQKILWPTIMRMCSEHPFHSLYQLFCLQPPKAAGTKSNRRATGRASGGLTTETEHNAGRSSAAKDVFNSLLNNPSTSDRTAAVEELCEASLLFANFSVGDSAKTGEVKPVPKDQLILNLRLSRLKVPVITAYTPVDPSKRYDPAECVCVHKYDDHFEIAGGANHPKIISCVGSDGRKYKQLFKSAQKDDLRQDAVMEQVFDVVNVVLRRDTETKKRNLYIRGYKVIPLASRAGILEFVSDTTPLKSWLDKAHFRYRPNDMRNIARELASHQKSSTPAAHYKFYLECMKKYKPVMRHYFTEMHKTPIPWFRSRLNYTRSVATTSIVGHILGLGDRHTSNILIDKIKGEVVHIDLGIAFDQGKLLPIPENVPFRMTPDMVDGMGISGTNGVFQRCSEETLRVLRDESDVIMTILQVFRYDPLYSWTVSDYKMKKQVENDDSSTTTMILKNPENERILSERLGLGINLDSTRAQEDADRALIEILSVAAAVRTLVAEATDTYNLGTIFYGWCPHN
ncbi:hypothetical protein BDP27DRAFT_1315847 [Rhodocollybia butyracea]|uniref:Serine/threonine-protein kinase Tel1 n=1 Tax=Rhodocollybia butyracea TaxID=206335 RepID=A0A9P5UCM7_9AGAR|nr:hypothetical protein BDP27DRAFT_1315847 [Rhodocollybia butyracea]